MSQFSNFWDSSEPSSIKKDDEKTVLHPVENIDPSAVDIFSEESNVEETTDSPAIDIPEDEPNSAVARACEELVNTSNALINLLIQKRFLTFNDVAFEMDIIDSLERKDKYRFFCGDHDVYYEYIKKLKQSNDEDLRRANDVITRDQMALTKIESEKSAIEEALDNFGGY